MAGSYVWWPSYSEDVTDIGDRGSLAAHLALVVVLGTVLSVPAVSRATGIDALTIALLLGGHVAWVLVGTLGLAAHPTRLRSNVLMAGNLVVNVSVAIAIPIATGDPRTPLWMLPVLYACANGAMQERERCVTFLLVHALAPLVAIVLVDDRGASGWNIAGPVLCAVFSAVGYNHLSSVSARWREVRAEQEAALAKLELEAAARDRALLALDLDDAVGSTLAVVGAYARTIEQYLDDPDKLQALAAMVREAALTGIGDLRAVISTLRRE